MSSFHVDGRVSIKLEYDLAVRLGEAILSSGSEDKQVLALGHKLLNLDEDNISTPNRPVTRKYYQEKQVIRDTGRVLEEARQEFAGKEDDWQSWDNFAEKPKTPINIKSKYYNKS